MFSRHGHGKSGCNDALQTYRLARTQAQSCRESIEPPSPACSEPSPARDRRCSSVRRAEEEPVVAVELSADEKIEELNNQLKDGTIGPHKVRRPSSATP